MDDKIEIGVHLSFQDYLRVTFWSLFRSIAMPILGAISVLPPAAILWLWASDPHSLTLEMAAFLLVPTGLFLFMLVAILIGAKRSWDTNKSLQETITYSFSPTGLEAVAPSSCGRAVWATLYRAIEIRHYLLLFISRNQMWILPKRCFTSAQLAAFRRLLSDQMANRASLRHV
jgi:hypothetical protein